MIFPGAPFEPNSNGAHRLRKELNVAIEFASAVEHVEPDIERRVQVDAKSRREQRRFVEGFGAKPYADSDLIGHGLTDASFDANPNGNIRAVSLTGRNGGNAAA